MSVIRIAGWFLNNRVLKGRRESVGSLASTFSDKAETVRSRWPAWFRRYGLVLAVYLGATWVTDAHFMGDTVGYAGAILASRLGDFGHLLLYPLGWSLSQLLMPATRFVVGADARTNVIITLITMSWLAGLLCVFMLHGVMRRISQRQWVANVTTLGLIFSQGFLNFAQTGCSYVPGLSLLLLAIYLSVTGGEKPEPSSTRAWGAGVTLAGAVGLWFPYVLSVPAALASPLLVFTPDRRRWRFVGQGAVAFALASAVMYGAAAVLQGIYTVAGFTEWIASNARGGSGITGVPRMVLGLARSFINMGNDGKVFKRFVVHDPLNPVSLSDMFGLSLWKIFLFYLLLGWIMVLLLRSARSRRILGLLVLNGVPVLAFAVSWQGGDMERYLPLYPVLFASLAYCLSSERPAPVFAIVVAAFMTTATVSNVEAMGKSVLLRRQNEVVARIQDLQPSLTPRSLVATVNQQDEVNAFYWTFPLHPINRAGSLSVYYIVGPGTPQVLQWRPGFASRTLSVWAAGGDVWVSKRVLSPHPRSEWNWVEGDDPRVSWADLYGFFSRLEMERPVGGDDGFELLLSSPKNRERLSRLLENWSGYTHVRPPDFPRGPR